MGWLNSVQTELSKGKGLKEKIAIIANARKMDKEAKNMKAKKLEELMAPLNHYAGSMGSNLDIAKKKVKKLVDELKMDEAAAYVSSQVKEVKKQQGQL